MPKTGHDLCRWRWKGMSIARVDFLYTARVRRSGNAARHAKGLQNIIYVQWPMALTRFVAPKLHHLRRASWHLH